MCSSQSNEDPTTYDQPKVTAPRAYVLSGYPDERPAEDILADLLPRGSVALAILGTMLTEAEYAEEAGLWPQVNRVQVLREARDRVAAAESER